MDQDGDLDVVTCRAREPVVPLIFGREDEELVWLENPSGNFSKLWNVHVLAHGPDVYFQYMRLNTPDGPKDCIFTSQFFTKSLNVFWNTDSLTSRWTSRNLVQSRVIANHIGGVFDVSVIDLNNDGRLDLLVTTNSGTNGTLLAFEIPDDFRTGTFKKHVLAVGFRPRKSGTGKGAPGSAFAVRPSTSSRGKPVILLSGDDDGRAYIISPNSQSVNDWSYTSTAFLDAGSGTVGQIAIEDVDGDGYKDVFAPSFSTGEIFVYTFAP